MNENGNKNRKIPPIVKWILWVLLVQFILVNISSSIYAYRLTHFYSTQEIKINESNNIFSRTWRYFTGPKQVKSLIVEQPLFPYEKISLQTASGVNIKGWYGRSDSSAKGTVILFHGITGNKSYLLEQAYEFRYWGYNVLMIDFRGHGESEGSTTTIGVKEPEEVKAAYDFIVQKGEKKIFLFGTSLGAVVIMKAVSDYSIQPFGLILEMPFLNLQKYLEARARTLGFPAQPFAFLTTFWIGIERGFNGYRHQACRYAKAVEVPVLMQWGGRDEFVLPGESEKIFKDIASSNKRKVIYENAGHEYFIRHDKERWRQEVGRFLEVLKIDRN